MRIARAVIAPDAAMHRVKGCVDRSDSRPSRRMGGLSSWRRAFRRLAFQPHGVCADTGVYAVVKEQRRARIISLSYTSRKIGLFITPSVEIFQNFLQMGKPFANGMMHGRLGGVFSIQDDHNLRLHNLDLPVGKIVTAFVENGLEVSEAHTCEESLEDYFKRVTGGEGIA